MKILLTVLLLSFLALSGCLDRDVPDDAAADGGEGSGSEGEAVADRIGVVFHTGTYEASPGMPATFDVEVPEGAVDVRFEISTVAVPGSATATVRLGGCGSEDVQWGGGGNIQIGVGGSSKDGDLCAAGEAGPQGLIVEAPMVPLSGTLTVRADVPSQ